MSSSEASLQPLRGVRVADLSRVLAGPVLHDGARRPRRRRGQGRAPAGRRRDALAGARPSRAGRRPTTSRSTAASAAARLDLVEPEGRELALELCAGAEVVIENFKVGGADRLGVDYEAVRERNPTVVYCSITGFGSRARAAGAARLRLRGPGRERPDVDHRAGGRPAVQGRRRARGRARGPARRGRRSSRRCTGERAARIEVPLLDSGLAGLVNVAQNALVTGREPERYGNAHPNIVPYQDFETASGRIAVAAANDGLFRALCRAIGLERARRRRASRPTPPGSSTATELDPELARPLPRAPGRGVAGRARRRRGAGRQGAVRARTRWRPPRRRAGPATLTVDHPTRRPARPGGLADLGRHRRPRRRRRRCWASTRPRCLGELGSDSPPRGDRGPARRSGGGARLTRGRSSAARRRSTPAGATPRPAT